MNTKLGVVLALSLSIFLSGCTVKQNTGNKTPSETSQNIVGKSTKEECMTGCALLWKANKDNSAKTEVEMSTYCNSLCDAGQGMQNLDPESCAKSEGALRDTCYSEIAKKTNNPELCAKIVTETFAGSCYRTISENTKDKTLCEKITVKYIKDSCLSK